MSIEKAKPTVHRPFFIVIGAQKAGTTTLFRLMAQHPALYIPPEKELPFFSENTRYSRGWSWFLKEFFANAPSNTLWGKVSPQYMNGNPVIAARIHATVPKAMLIAILREPVQRALSHYSMMRRQGKESRPPDHMVEEELDPQRLLAARIAPAPTNSYIVQGEYGRILSEYYKLFDRQQILVVSTSELAGEPARLIKEIFGFLGVDYDFVPQGLKSRHHVGAARRRFPFIEDVVAKSPSGRWLRSLLPAQIERRLRFQFKQWNAKGLGHEVRLSPAGLTRLRRHYETDAVLLQRLGVKMHALDGSS